MGNKQGVWMKLGMLLCSAAMLLCSGAAMAKSNHEASLLEKHVLSKIDVNKKGQVTRTYSFESLGKLKDIKLYGVDGRQDLSFSVRKDEVVNTAILNVKYSYSAALLHKISQINVMVNGFTVKSFPVSKKFPTQGMFEVKIDPMMLDEYNRITFQLIGHYTITECEYPNHSSLWAVIDNRSTLTLKTEKLSMQSDLAQLPYPFFDYHDNSLLSVPMYFAAKPTLYSVKAAGIVASWLGKYATYRGVKFPVHLKSLPRHGNAIVFMTKKDRLLGMSTEHIKASSIAIRRNPNDPLGHILILMGKDEAELVTLASGLALGQVALSGTQDGIVDMELPPLRHAYDAPNWLPSDRAVQFGELSRLDDMQVKGIYPSLINVQFKFPPDLFEWQVDGLKVKLKYNYSAPMDDGVARLNVSFNKHFIDSIALKGADVGESASSWFADVQHRWFSDGLRMQEEDLALPISMMGFDNAMQFQYYLRDESVGKCRERPGKYFQASIDPHSTIDISDIPHHVKMPNIGLFVNAGFPFTRMADLSETAVIIPDKLSKQTIYTFLAIMGMMGKETGYPVIYITVDHQLEGNSDKDLLFIGALNKEDILKPLANEMPLDLVQGKLQLKKLSTYQYSKHLLLRDRFKEDYAQGGRLISKSAGNLGLITGFESPWSSGRSVVVVSGSDAENLAEVADNLVTNQNLRKVFADTVILTDEMDKVRAHIISKDNGRVEQESDSGFYSGLQLLPEQYRLTTFNFAEAYDDGDLPFWDWLRWYLSAAPWFFFMICVLAALLLAVVVYSALRMRAKRRLTHNGQL